MRSAEASAVLATDSRESTVALLAAANCSGVVNMVESPELIVNADVGHAIAGSEFILLHCNMIPIIEPVF
jgi:hypothetical protein